MFSEFSNLGLLVTALLLVIIAMKLWDYVVFTKYWKSKTPSKKFSDFERSIDDEIVNLENKVELNDIVSSKTYKIYKELLGASESHQLLGLLVSASLLLSISRVADDITHSPNENKMSKTVVGLMLGEKVKKSTKAYLLLFLSSVVNLTFYLVFNFDVSIFIIVLSLFGFLAIYVDHKMIEYRLKIGVYGTNSFESREIINFMLSHSNKNDFNDSGGLKRVIPTPELDVKKESYTVEGVKA